MIAIARSMRSLLVLFLMAPAACSGDPQPSENEASAAISTYQGLASGLTKRVHRYRIAMMAPGAFEADCTDIHDRYDQQARERLAALVEDSSDMARLMERYGGGDEADFECVTGAMLEELDLHGRRACSTGDANLDRQETSRHVDAMFGYADHLWERCEEMSQGMRHHQWSWGPMMEACDRGPLRCRGMMHCGDGGPSR